MGIIVLAKNCSGKIAKAPICYYKKGLDKKVARRDSSIISESNCEMDGGSTESIDTLTGEKFRGNYSR